MMRVLRHPGGGLRTRGRQSRLRWMMRRQLNLTADTIKTRIRARSS